MLETLIALLAAHLIADFPLQTDAMIQRKREPVILLLHVATVTLVSACTLGWLAWPVLGWIAVTHVAMDFIKVRFLGQGLRAFVADQGVHLVVIVALTLSYPETATRGAWGLLPDAIQPWFHAALAMLAAMLAATMMGGIIIGLLLKRLATAATLTIGGLPEGGRYIGWLERGLTVVFVVMGEPTGVGLLLAAKSILRFGDIKDTQDRARAEYIMIGTFLSIGWALPIAAIARRAIMPPFT